MARKKQKSTFSVRLKAMVCLDTDEPHVGIEIGQPFCFGSATLILSEADIDWWERVLEEGRQVIRRAKEAG